MPAVRYHRIKYLNIFVKTVNAYISSLLQKVISLRWCFSLNNLPFSKYPNRIHLKKHVRKDTLDNMKSASYPNSRLKGRT